MTTVRESAIGHEHEQHPVDVSQMVVCDGGRGATTLKHYADPVSEVDRRAAAHLAELTGGIRT